jgi:hypothetical protein
MLITGCLVQVGAWLMHLFMVQIEVQVDAWLMHGSVYWYWSFGADRLVQVYSSLSHSDSVIVVP